MSILHPLQSPGFQRFGERELALCAWFNRGCRWESIRAFFAIVSRLGDGVFWYVLIVALPLMFGHEALPASMQMALSGLLGVVVYKYLKPRTLRPRPFAVDRRIRLGAMPLDRYSFPSGHTLHATCFTVTAVHYYPELVWLAVPFTLLVALSRIVLGLHYPSDVLAGAAIGAFLALALIPH